MIAELLGNIALLKSLREGILKNGWSFIAHFIIPICVIALSISQVTVLVPSGNLFGQLTVHQIESLDIDQADERFSGSIFIVDNGVTDLNIDLRDTPEILSSNDLASTGYIKNDGALLRIEDASLPIGKQLVLFTDVPAAEFLRYRGKTYSTEELKPVTGAPARLVVWTFIAAVFGFGLFMSGNLSECKQTESKQMS